MKIITANYLQPGMVIVEGEKKTPVRQVELFRCLRHVHVNGDACYHMNAEVVISQ